MVSLKVSSDTGHWVAVWLNVLAALLLLMGLGFVHAGAAAATTVADAEEGVPLVIGQRTIHVFRAPVGMFSAADRVRAAHARIAQAFEQSGDGWTSVKSTAGGVEVAIDGAPLFLVVAGDARAGSGETQEDLANKASRVLQKAWSEARERRDPNANIKAFAKAALATVLLLLVLILGVKASFKARPRIEGVVARRLKALSLFPSGSRSAELVPAIAGKSLVLATWMLGLVVFFFYLTYTLDQFVLTRPASETLAQSIHSKANQVLGATAESLPGMFIAAFIFLLAWIATRISTELFAAVEAAPSSDAILNVHTAPATRRIVNASLWLFAIAMAYPYLPGSNTEAFKGLSVMVGLMVSIGASGVVGQVTSGMMIVYTYALKRGEYVRIQEFEGTVTEIGLFVTRLRTGLGEEIALPNTFVLANVTRNFSRSSNGGYVLDLTISIGYDTPWRQVHAMLLEAAKSVAEISDAPPAYVVQTALSDFYVAYKLVTQVNANAPASRARIASDLHAAIQDVFNRYGVQIMSPHYLGDPPDSKIVPESNWHAFPAKGDVQDVSSRPKVGR